MAALWSTRPFFSSLRLTKSSALKRNLFLQTVATRRYLVYFLEEPVKAGEIVEAHIQGDVADFLIGFRDLPGGVIEAGLVDDDHGRGAKPLTRYPGHVLLAATAQALELANAKDGMLGVPDQSMGVLQPVGAGFDLYSVAREE